MVNLNNGETSKKQNFVRNVTAEEIEDKSIEEAVDGNEESTEKETDEANYKEAKETNTRGQIYPSVYYKRNGDSCDKDFEKINNKRKESGQIILDKWIQRLDISTKNKNFVITGFAGQINRVIPNYINPASQVKREILNVKSDIVIYADIDNIKYMEFMIIYQLLKYKIGEGTKMYSKSVDFNKTKEMLYDITKLIYCQDKGIDPESFNIDRDKFLGIES